MALKLPFEKWLLIKVFLMNGVELTAAEVVTLKSILQIRTARAEIWHNNLEIAQFCGTQSCETGPVYTMLPDNG